tara:strand:+ start:170 stop:1528 length:1359 start_codon:yes stop_codon:yes gene_type:complete
MKIKFYRSATVGIIFQDFKLLCDPWLTDGEYYGSWYHYPKFNLNKNSVKDLNSYDAIYISHIHPDHCSEKTLSKINKNIPIYIHSYHAKFLKFKLSNLGFNVIELDNNKKFSLTKNVFINIVAADNCDPQLCYKFTGCAELKKTSGSQQIDSYAFIGDKKHTILNINDCPFDLAQASLKKSLKNYKKVDLLLTGYGGAGPYPQCFDNLKTIEKKKEAILKKNNFLRKAINFIELVTPRFYLPFAGRYVLGGKLSSLNNLKGVPELTEAYEFIEKHFAKKDGNKVDPLKLNPGSSYNFENNTYSSKFMPTDKKHLNIYLKKISKKKLLYEKDPMPSLDHIKELCQTAFSRYLSKNKRLGNFFDTSIYINFKIGIIELSLSKEKLSFLKKGFLKENIKNNYVEYSLDPKLFLRLLRGPKYAHWNNAEIGSHIKYIRKPNIFNRGVYQSICYFHN